MIGYRNLDGARTFSRARAAKLQKKFDIPNHYIPPPVPHLISQNGRGGIRSIPDAGHGPYRSRNARSDWPNDIFLCARPR